jgi:hypothetical protein
MASSPRSRVRRGSAKEPSWGRVLATTIELWAWRRLRHLGFLRGPASGQRGEKRARRGRPGTRNLALAVIAAAVAVAGALQFTGIFPWTAARAVSPPSSKSAGAPAVAAAATAATQAEVATWIVGQVSGSAIVGCYPAMCAALQGHGDIASRLVPLGPGLGGAFEADVVVTSASTGKRLVDEYAPALIASFGSGGSRVEIRAVARGGAAAYKAAMRADLAARKSAAGQLLRNPRIRFTASDAARLRAGEVDSRLLATLAALSSQYSFGVTAFGDAAPGAQPLYRQATITMDGRGNSPARLAAALTMVNAQAGPYLPAHSAIIRLGGGRDVLRIEFAAPGALGLLTTVLTADIQGAGAQGR